MKDLLPPPFTSKSSIDAQTLRFFFKLLVFHDKSHECISPPVSPSTGLASMTAGSSIERNKHKARSLFMVVTLVNFLIRLAAISREGERCIPASWSSAFEEAQPPATAGTAGRAWALSPLGLAWHQSTLASWDFRELLGWPAMSWRCNLNYKTRHFIGNSQMGCSGLGLVL